MPSKYADELAQANLNANITIQQLLFMESFVEDLLNLHMMTQGVFKLEEQYFDPQAAIDFVLDMIRVSAHQCGIKILSRNL